MVPCVDVTMPDGSVECFECRYLSQDKYGVNQDPCPVPNKDWNFTMDLETAKWYAVIK